MRSRTPDATGSTFFNEKTARKQAERQLLTDAASGGMHIPSIDWNAAQTITPALLAGQRIQLRLWTQADREPFAAMTSNPDLMRHFPAVLGRAESDAWIDRTIRRTCEHGWGFWALDYWAEGALAPHFAGFTGLNVPDTQLQLGPCVEIGWRLAPQFWGLGLASEAARMALRAGFESLGLEEIFAITTLRNTRSRAVMQRLGMKESTADEFDHPAFQPDNPERRCCVYRLTRARWSENLLVSAPTQG